MGVKRKLSNPSYMTNESSGYPGGPIDWPEADSSTFKAGDFVYINTDGKVAICGADPTLIAGIACIDGQNGTGKTTSFLPIGEGDVLSMNVYHSTAGSSKLDIKMLYAQYGLVYDSTLKIWLVDLEDTTAKRVLIVGFQQGPQPVDNALLMHVGASINGLNGATDGDVYGRVLVKVLAAIRQATV